MIGALTSAIILFAVCVVPLITAMIVQITIKKRLQTQLANYKTSVKYDTTAGSEYKSADTKVDTRKNVSYEPNPGAVNAKKNIAYEHNPTTVDTRKNVAYETNLV